MGDTSGDVRLGRACERHLSSTAINLVSCHDTNLANGLCCTNSSQIAPDSGRADVGQEPVLTVTDHDCDRQRVVIHGYSKDEMR